MFCYNQKIKINYNKKHREDDYIEYFCLSNILYKKHTLFSRMDQNIKQSLEQYHCHSMVQSLVQPDIHITISSKYYLDLIHHASLKAKDG